MKGVVFTEFMDYVAARYATTRSLTADIVGDAHAHAEALCECLLDLPTACI